MNKIEVVAHDDRWTSQFNKESLILQNIFKSELSEVYHIGSTSILSIKAKPIIDIMPVVKQIYRVDKFNDVMMGNGYYPWGENGIERRRFFTKDIKNRLRS